MQDNKIFKRIIYVFNKVTIYSKRMGCKITGISKSEKNYQKFLEGTVKVHVKLVFKYIVIW